MNYLMKSISARKNGELDISVGLLKQGHGGHFHVTAHVMFTVIRTGFNADYRLSPNPSDGEINHCSVYYLFIERHGVRSRNFRYHSSPHRHTRPVSLPRTLFFHVEALPGCPPQQNSKSHLVFDSSYLSMENALKLLIFSIFHMHTSIFFSIFIYTHKCILVLHI